MPSFTLDSRLDGAVGGKTSGALEKAFGMRTVGDLLAHYPRRYARRGELTPIASLPLGEPVTIVAEVGTATLPHQWSPRSCARASGECRTGAARCSRS